MHFICYILQSGRTPLHEALECTDEEVADALIEAGANVNMVSYFQMLYNLINIHMRNNDGRIVLKGNF